MMRSKTIWSAAVAAGLLALAGCGGGGGGGGGGGVLSNAFTWVSGDNAIDSAGSCGSLGVASASNKPGARNNAATARDASGNLWMFGGSGTDCNGGTGYLADLWKFDGNQWTFVAGYGANVNATCGGVIAVNDCHPGARDNAIMFFDSTGKLWIFGGYGYRNNSTAGYLNDIWKFDPANTTTNPWTFMFGSVTVNDRGLTTPGSQHPGGRAAPAHWVWQSVLGTYLFIYGGSGYDIYGTLGNLSDIWYFNTTPGSEGWNLETTAANNPLAVNQSASWGALGVGADTNIPGGRYDSVSWIDASGNLWLFGGQSGAGYFNDLWKYDRYGAVPHQWIWMGGSNTVGQSGHYGTKGTAAAANIPGARAAAVAWRDSSGTTWLSGGWGLDSAGATGHLNDLWKFNGTSWTWVAGDNTVNHPGTYGTKGTAATTNVPGARFGAAASADGSGRLWLFGGRGYSTNGVEGDLNDLWVYQP